jgi:hypothetical protein
LKHRRIRAEAAAALAQLGDPHGIAELVQLAQWPVSRLRALAFAEELGALDQIDPSYQTEVARAEGQLAAWLAEPAQFGVAPIELELVDQRELYWPGYDQPQTCYLFRFMYPTQQGTWSNVGMAGPAPLAASAGLEHLRPERVYALYAGWQTTHDEIYEVELMKLSPERRDEIDRLALALQQRGCRDVQPVCAGKFFGDEFLVATAHRGDQRGHVIGNRREWLFLADDAQQLTSELAYALFKGQKLLASFNPEYAATVSDEP